MQAVRGLSRRALCTQVGVSTLRISRGHHPAAAALPWLSAPDKYNLHVTVNGVTLQDDFFGRCPLPEVAAFLQQAAGTEGSALVAVAHPQHGMRVVGAQGDVPPTPALAKRAFPALDATSLLPSASPGVEAAEWRGEALSLAHAVGCRVALLVGDQAVAVNGGQPLRSEGRSAAGTLGLSYAYVAVGAALVAAGVWSVAGSWHGSAESETEDKSRS